MPLTAGTGSRFDEQGAAAIAAASRANAVINQMASRYSGNYPTYNQGSPVIYSGQGPTGPSLGFAPVAYTPTTTAQQNTIGSPVIYSQGGGAWGNKMATSAGAMASSRYGIPGMTGSPAIYRSGMTPAEERKQWADTQRKNKKGGKGIDYSFTEEIPLWRNQSRQNQLDKYYADMMNTPETQTQQPVTYKGGGWGGYGGYGGYGGGWNSYAPNKYYDWYFSLLNWRI